MSRQIAASSTKPVAVKLHPERGQPKTQGRNNVDLVVTLQRLERTQGA